MTVGRTVHPEDVALQPGEVAYVLIDDTRRLVLAPVELGARTAGRATYPIIGRLELGVGETKELLKASWEGPTGTIAEADLPPFLSWAIQVKTGSAQLRPNATAENRFDVPLAPGAFAETEGSSVANWFAVENAGAPAMLQILGTVSA